MKGKISLPWLITILLSIIAIIVSVTIPEVRYFLGIDKPITPPSAKIENIWGNHHVFKNNQTGINIHVKFSVSGMSNKRGFVMAGFYFLNGNVLKDFNDNEKYRTTSGNVSVQECFISKYETELYEDFILFMPYDEFHLIEGNLYSLKFQVVLFDHNWDMMAISDWVHFTVDKRDSSPNSVKN